MEVPIVNGKRAMSFRNAHMKARNYTGAPRGYNLNARWSLERVADGSSESDSDD